MKEHSGIIFGITFGVTAGVLLGVFVHPVLWGLLPVGVGLGLLCEYRGKKK